MDPTDELAQQLVAQFAHDDRMLMVTLIAFGFILSVVLAAYGIVLTHKVAGPLFKITNHLDKIRDGKLGVVYNLRKGDQLVDFFEHFKGAHDALRHAHRGGHRAPRQGHRRRRRERRSPTSSRRPSSAKRSR